MSQHGLDDRGLNVIEEEREAFNEDEGVPGVLEGVPVAHTGGVDRLELLLQILAGFVRAEVEPVLHLDVGPVAAVGDVEVVLQFLDDVPLNFLELGDLPVE